MPHFFRDKWHSYSSLENGIFTKEKQNISLFLHLCLCKQKIFKIRKKYVQ